MLKEKTFVYCKETHYIYDEITIRRMLYSCGNRDEKFFKSLYERISLRQITQRLRNGEQIRIDENDPELCKLGQRGIRRQNPM